VSAASVKGGDSASTVAGKTEEEPEETFADIIRQISSASSQPQSDAATANPDTTPRFQLTKLVPAADAESTDETSTTNPTVGKQGNRKESAGLGIGLPGNSVSSIAEGTAKGPSVGLVALPVDIAAPPVTIKPKLGELAEEGSAQHTQIGVQTPSAAISQPEVALNIVIRTGEAAATSQDEGAQQTADNPVVMEGSAGQPGADVAPAALSALPTELPALPAAAAVMPVPVSSLVPGIPGIEVERKKTAADGLGASDAGGAPTPVGQAGAYQDLQLKAEPAKTADNAPPRNDAPRPPVAAQELPAPEKGPAQPLKSLALEFTPDGAGDVRVRLAERGGELHVSLHSNDPSVAKSLRDGATDLTGVLTHAGYEAETWTSGRQRQENPQQRDTETPSRSARSSGAGGESFDGVLQQPDIL